MDELRKYLANFIELNEDDWKAFGALFSPAILKKGEYFAIEGRLEKNLAFLTKGVVRAFYRNKEGVEYNKSFFVPCEFFGAYASLVTGEENQINLQALTDCRILRANYSSITALYDSRPMIERITRLIAEYLFVYKEKREIELVLLHAEERYKLFREEYPGLENQIPQYHIASYLGVTPTQLSRIRSAKK